jgi:hypothetical protein
MFGKAFKSRANYVFDYKPRYYDERKERLEKLKKQYENVDDNDEDFKPSLIKSGLKTDWQRSKHLAHDKKANLRLALIIVILVGIFAYILDLHKLF